MKYCLAKEMAEKWNVSRRTVQKYCCQGKIPGVKKYGDIWIIPSNTQKPVDGRKHNVRIKSQSLYPGICLFYYFRFDGRSLEELANALPNEDYRREFWLEASFYRGETEAFYKGLKEESKNTTFSLSRCFMEIIVAIRTGDLDKAMAQLNVLQKMEAIEAGQEMRQQCVPLAKALISASIYDIQKIPEWLKQANFMILPADIRPIALIIYAKYLQAKGHYEQMLGVVEATLNARTTGSFNITDLYLMIVEAEGNIELGKREKAKEILNTAFRFAKPYGFFTPFSENIAFLRGTLDEVIKERYPDDYKRIVGDWKKIRVGWTAFHNSVRGYQITTALSLKETQIALYRGQGLTYEQIAKNLHLKCSTVNNYMQVIREKLQIKSSKDVVKYIFWIQNSEG